MINKNEPLFHYKLLNFSLEKNYDLLIVTSRMAVKSLIQNNQINTKIRIILVGQKSAELLKKNNFINIIYIAENAKELMYFIEKHSLSKEKACYLRGNYITYDICQKYKNFDEKIVYEIDYNDDLSDAFKENLTNSKIDKLMFFSFKSMDEFIQICELKNLLTYLKNIDAFSINKSSKNEWTKKIFKSVTVFH